jgi:chaperonin GroEL|tara:strand:+ start:2341 stop:4023 length:1683 start_codon:yes stop_codon:yes gene_type:complete
MSTAPKNIIFSKEAREKTLAGVRILRKAVAATLGPKGRNALIERGYGDPFVTKDGVSVAKEINLKDPFEQMGNLIVRDAASRTNNKAGDGTTTSTILAAAIMEEGMKHLGKGANPILIKKGIDRAVKLVVEELQEHSKPVESVEDLVSIATISSQDEEIGKMAAQAIWDAGDQGIVSIEESKGMGMEVDKSDGFKFDKGYVSSYMITEPKRKEAIYEDVHILLLEKDMTASREVIPIMENLLKGAEDRQSIKHLVIICDNVLNEALSTVVVNKLKGNFFTLAIRAPAYGDLRTDIMEDIAAWTGATYISNTTGRKIDTLKFEDLGKARRVIATKDDTVIVDGSGQLEDVQKRVTEIESQLKKDNTELVEKQLKERLAALSGCAIVLRIGAATEVEQKEKQYRVDDALCACRAAKAEGVLPGGGVPYLRAARNLEELKFENRHEDIGREIVCAALLEPIRYLARNAGINEERMIKECSKVVLPSVLYSWGYDALKEEYCNLSAAQVFDPTKVAREALENAASVASTWLTLETAVTEIVPEGMPNFNVMAPTDAPPEGYSQM